jgi:hypothetical protein
MTGFFTYFERVFVPRFSKSSQSFSSYGKSAERRFQTFFWLLTLTALGCLVFHISALGRCLKEPRANICFVNFYTWGVYMVFAAFATLMAMLLHYGYVDPDEGSEPEFHDIDQRIYEEDEHDVI